MLLPMNIRSHFPTFVGLRRAIHSVKITNNWRGQLMTLKLGQHCTEMERSPSTIRVSIPLRASNWTAQGVKVFEGRLEAIEAGKAQICLDQPLPVGTEIDLLVELKDRQDREIRFRYQGKVASAATRRWYQMEVNFKECGGISGKDAREVLADLFPKKTGTGLRKNQRRRGK